MQNATLKKDKRLHNLKKWREVVGLKQDDIAVLLGCTKSNYCQKERGNSTMRLTEMLLIQKAFNDRLEKVGLPTLLLDDIFR